jgi:sugar phosphate isomerase/epimerase
MLITGDNTLTWTLSGFADEAGASLDEQISALKTAGLKYIDIRGVDGYNIVDLPLDHAKTVKDKLDQAGISVQMFGSPIGKIDIADDFETDLKRIDHLAKLAPILGTSAVRIFSYYNASKRPAVEWKKISLSRLLSLRSAANDTGLVLYHENEREIFGDLVENVLTLGTEVRDGKSFRTIFDFDNYTQGDQNALDAWQLVKADVDAIHLKDSAGKQHVPVGEGEGFIEKILLDALAIGWHGPLSVEPHLSHSGAVAATGPSGIENQSFKDMKDSERFILACNAATALLKRINAPFE